MRSTVRLLGIAALAVTAAGCASTPRLWINGASEVRRCGATSSGWGLAGVAAAAGAARANAECAEDLRRLGYVPFPTVRSGIAMQGTSPRITRIVPRSPADVAGFKVSDALKDVDGRENRSATDYARLLNERRAGNTIRITVDREGALFAAAVTLVAEPE